MRLLHVDSLKLAEFRDDDRPTYAIASHRWQKEEVTFQEVRGGDNKHKQGYQKVEAFARYVRENVRSIKWLWIDTCCINKENAAELSKAINLMFDWYRDAEVCIAHLADVSTTAAENYFLHSEWFERGWTLQELLAPKVVVFVTKAWEVIGNKGASFHKYNKMMVGVSLESYVAAKTGIPEEVLHDYDASRAMAVDIKLTWIEGRKTSEEEDMSYALYGICGVTPGANYGEKHSGARERLLAAVNQRGKRAAQKAGQFRKIADWISPPDPWTNHETARQRHEDQTGTWMLQSEQYQKWKTGAVRSLWVHGKAGCGKTILCSTAIEDIRRHCDQRANTGYAVFYFSFSDNRKQSVEDLVLSIVVQLGWKEPALSMLRQAYERPNRSIPGLGDLKKILLASINAHNEVFLILDALDECPEGGDVQQKVLEFLRDVSQQGPNLRVLATSRELPDINDSMELFGAASLPVAEHSVDSDIRRYVAAQLSRNPRLSRLDKAIKLRIEETMSTKADGMFRWAYCQLQELKKLKSTKPKFIHEALNSMPSTLDETYERMLTGIEQIFRQDALTLLRWLAYAQSPPSLRELVDATIVELDNGIVETNNRGSLEDTLQILSGLVVTIRSADSNDLGKSDRDEIQEAGDDNYTEQHDDGRQQIGEGTKIRLAHFSVKEYLESARILQGHAQDFHLQSGREHRFLAQSCLVYIGHYSASSEKRLSEKDLEDFPLLNYAARSWFYHSKLQYAENVDREVVLLHSAKTTRDWLLVHQPDQDWKRPFVEALEEGGSGLYYASFLGLGAVTHVLIDAGADVNAQGGLYGNALQAASLGGREKVVQLLVDTKADVNAQGGIYGNALRAASFGGRKKVVQMLMDAGADVNSSECN